MTAIRPPDLDSRNTPLTVYVVLFVPVVVDPALQETLAFHAMKRIAVAAKKHLLFDSKSWIVTH
jgi:hypothetical protein